MYGRSWQDEWIDKIKRGKFFPINNTFFKYRMKPAERAVYLYLVSISGVSKKCYPSKKTIAKHCCCSKNTVDEAIKMLVREGFITSTHTYRGNHQMNNLYNILELPPLEGRSVDDDRNEEIITEEEKEAAPDSRISEIYKDQLPEAVTA